jgi:hypothetical protein
MTKPFDLTVLFPDEMLMDYASRLLEDAESRLVIERVKGRGERYVQFAAVGPRGGHVDIVAPFGSAKVGTLFFRSLLKISKGSQDPVWMINGQGGVGTSEIAFFGENGPWLTTTLSNVREYLAANRENVSADGLAKFDAWVDSRMQEVVDDGLVSEDAMIHSWGDETERYPLKSPTTHAAP